MLLSVLLKHSGIAPVLADCEIGSLCHDSRRAVPGSLFFALKGQHADGASYARDAVSRGASAVVSPEPLPECGVPVVCVGNPRADMARIAAAFFNAPSSSLKCVGVTGTNGKTTTTFLIRHLLEAAGLPCGLIGTIQYSIGGEDMPAARTTPEATELQELLARIRDTRGRAVAMEVSSHALIQHRADAIDFDVAIFTNLTQDHLDYHGTMDAYFEAKARLFDLAAAGSKKAAGVINGDDRWGHRLADRNAKRMRVLTFGRRLGVDFRAAGIRYEHGSTVFQLEARGKSFLVRLPLIGLFNVYNTLAALAAATALGIELRASVAALADAPQVPGRLERVGTRKSLPVFVDYAHTDDALRNVLQTVRQLEPARLITVFGCGGDRDRAKRPLMAAASDELSDFTILTSDNPRSEDPEQIIREIETGMKSSRYRTVLDRETAIRTAIEMAHPGDVVLIAGKGHEKYQQFADRTVPFDDVAVAERALAEKRVEA